MPGFPRASGSRGLVDPVGDGRHDARPAGRVRGAEVHQPGCGPGAGPGEAGVGDHAGLQPGAEGRRLHAGDRVAVGEDDLAGDAVGVEHLVAHAGVVGAAQARLVVALPLLDVLAVQLLDHRAVLVAGDQPLVELGVHRRLEVLAVVLDEQAGVGVGRDDDVGGVALVDACHGSDAPLPPLCRCSTVSVTLLQTSRERATVRWGRPPPSPARRRPSPHRPGPRRRGRRRARPGGAGGAAALTMRRLAAELEVGTPTIYWHVGSRDDLVAAIVRTQSERLAERPVEGATARDRVLAAALHIYRGDRAPGHHVAGPPDGHGLAAAPRPRSRAGGRAGGRRPRRRRAPTPCARSSWSSRFAGPGAAGPSRFPEDYRADVLWAGSAAPVTPSARAVRRARHRCPDRRHAAPSSTTTCRAGRAA